MTWQLDGDRPIYIQLMEHIQLKIVSGEYKPGDKLPSVRDLAAEASVNPNTMQKALTELERKSLVFSQRTNGRFITEDMVMIQSIKDELAKEQVTKFIENMNKIGLNKEEIIELIRNIGREIE